MSPVSLSQDYFSFFGLPRKLSLDTADLQSRFYSLSRQFHPDRFARGTRRGSAICARCDRYPQRRATGCLRDPMQRAEYLLTQEGFDIGEQRSKNVPPELLEEVFELNMLLEETPERDELERGSRTKFQSHAGRNRRGTVVPVRTATTQSEDRDGSSRHSWRLEPPPIYPEPRARRREGSRKAFLDLLSHAIRDRQGADAFHTSCQHFKSISVSRKALWWASTSARPTALSPLWTHRSAGNHPAPGRIAHRSVRRFGDRKRASFWSEQPRADAC